jgi:hypothetical protein
VAIDPSWPRRFPPLAYVRRGGIEPPTRGFSVPHGIIDFVEKKADRKGGVSCLCTPNDPADVAVREAIKAAVDAGRLDVAGTPPLSASTAFVRRLFRRPHAIESAWAERLAVVHAAVPDLEAEGLVPYRSVRSASAGAPGVTGTAARGGSRLPSGPATDRHAGKEDAFGAAVPHLGQVASSLGREDAESV